MYDFNIQVYIAVTVACWLLGILFGLIAIKMFKEFLERFEDHRHMYANPGSIWSFLMEADEAIGLMIATVSILFTMVAFFLWVYVTNAFVTTWF